MLCIRRHIPLSPLRQTSSPINWKSLRFLATFKPAEPLTIRDINQHTVEAKYAVRGKIPIIADGLQDLIHNNPESHGLPFSKIVNANIGNPQQLEQRPLTWYRQVLSILQYPDVLKSNHNYPKDVVTRAETILKSIGSVGAYSHSQGAQLFRKSIADFIAKRDGYPANPSNLFLTSGASTAVSYLLQILSADENSGFLIPIPQYPLYTATIALNNAKPIGYYLDEHNHWSTNPEEIRELIEKNKANGVNIKALVVINPGNPTGSILSPQDMIELIDIAAEYGLVLIADEVYQENIFKGKFVSFKRILSELLESEPETYKNVQLASLHSTSKGVSGECGQRGGYMELVGFKPEVKDIVFKLASINLCSVVSGQALMELMINPPKEGDESYELYKKETGSIHNDLETRADLLYHAFLEMEDIKCNKPMGAMYIFPTLEFSPEKYHKLFSRAKNSDLQIDDIYCIELLEHTGICCVPGNGFGQKEGTFHLRTTFLPPGKEWIDRWTDFHKAFVNKYKD
ncbi:ALT1 Probable alanine aminotransferase [Candida maltosa Xu316]|uniref:Glutamate pyruvate transaminase n=1 Tax=Candida maltosa (strain Xu316) TaxID=1245528 RepID=M3K6N2_CANMX|nr:Alanine aminotransferase, mitochondrial, putative (Glutamic-pyruvic transaminase, putative) [Candida maltosa Xu316]